MNTPIWAMLLVIISTLIGAYGSILLKKGAEKFNRKIWTQFSNYNLIIGLGLYVFSSIFYLIALRNGDLSIIYPLTAAQYIWISLLAQKILKEKMNNLKWIGISLICLGIILIAI